MLATTQHAAGLLVLRLFPSRHAIPNTPAELPGACVVCFPQEQRPSLCYRKVGFRIATFEACSGFTHVMACHFAEPLNGPFPPKAPTGSLPPPPLRLLPAETTIAGEDFHLLKTNTFARRTITVLITAITIPITIR